MSEIDFNFYLQNNIFFKNFYKFSLFISNLFNTKSLLTILFILYIYNILTITQIIEFLLLTTLIIFIKYLIQRNRPFVTNNKIKNLDNSKLDPYSFPSGHMFTASLLTLYLQKILPQYKKILYFLPFFVGFSRIQLGVHHLTDVIASYLFSKFIFTYISYD
jgi:membrane-associated phospholipid phosphatase